MKTSRTMKWATAGLVFGMAVLGSGLALASVPDGNTVHACRKNSGGALRVIDTGASQKCTSTETAIDFTNWKFRGAYNSSNAYNAGDVVFSNGSSYMKLTTSGPNIPPTSLVYWGIVAEAGATGPKGATGATGPAGPKGPGSTTTYFDTCKDCLGGQLQTENVWHSILQLTGIPAGLYVVNGRVGIAHMHEWSSVWMECRLLNNSKEIDYQVVKAPSDGLWEWEVVLQDTNMYAAGNITLQCKGDETFYPGNAKLNALQVGSALPK